MSIIDELIKAAKAEVQEQSSEPVEINSNDIDKFAEYLKIAGEILQEGGEVETLPPVKGTQEPVETEVEEFDTTEGTTGEGGEVSTDEPVEGEQQPAAPSGFKQRVMKIAQESTPSSIGESPAEVSTSLPEEPEDIAETTKGEIEEENVVKPLKPLFKETPRTSAEAMAKAFPQAVEGEEKVSELQGRIAAHAFVQELNSIYGGQDD